MPIPHQGGRALNRRFREAPKRFIEEIKWVFGEAKVVIEEIKWIFGEAYALKSRFTPGVFTVLFTPSEFGRLFTLRSST